MSNEKVNWYAMKSMGRVLQMKKYLRQRGIYSWAPFASAPHSSSTKGHIADNSLDAGTPAKPLCDATDNLMPLLFFRTTEATVRGLHANPLFDAYIYRDLGQKYWSPITISPFEVKMFRLLRELHKGNVQYFSDAHTLLRKGQAVRITGGDFKGFEGIIRRVKHNKCLYVNISGVCAVAVAYVPQCFVQPISPSELSVASSLVPENNDIKSKESEILRLSDWSNSLAFARVSDAAAYLRKLSSEELATLSRHFHRLRAACAELSVKPAALWLLYDEEEWFDALMDEMQERIRASRNSGLQALSLQCQYETPAAEFMWEE